jgi:LysM repeat protein
MGMRGMVWMGLCAVLATGCVSSRHAQSERVRQEQAALSLETEIARLKERMRAVDGAQQDAYREVEACRESLRALDARVERECSELRLMIKALQDARAQDREAIVGAISKRVSEVVSASGSGGRGARTERGYEHTVQPGQTLSEIAAAYNVRVDAIVRANSLANANAIRSGQVLFIPE